MARVMLDTDVCVNAMRRRSPETRQRLERTTPGEVAVSSIVAAELWTGVMKSNAPDAAAEAVHRFIVLVTVLDWPSEAARLYGEIRARLEASGQSIGAMDMLIAAHALHLGLTLITRNVSEFRRVPGLRIESW